MTEAERAVIGCVLLDNDAWWRVAGLCSATDFTSPDLAEIWSAFDFIAGEGFPLDPVTVNEMRGLDLALLVDLHQSSPSPANAEHYAKLVRDAANARGAKKLLATALNEDKPDLAGLMAQLESLTTSGTDMTLAEAVHTGVLTAERAREMGLPTGIPSLDRCIHLTAGKLVIVAARPGVGKTALVWQWLLHMAQHDCPVGMISLEMGPEELGIRALANRKEIDALALFRGKAEAVAEAKHHKLNLPIRLDHRSVSLPEIVSRLTEWRHKHGIRLAAIDYLQLMDAEGDNRNAELGRITRTLKKLARRLEIPIVVLCQLNRALEKTGRKPMLVDLRDSGEIEQDADIVLALHSEPSEGDRPRRVELGVLKNRAGMVGWRAETIMFHGSIQQFREVA